MPMSSMIPMINLETAIEILAACQGQVIQALVEEQRSTHPNQEHIEGYRMVIGQLSAERKALNIDDDAAITRVRFFYGLLLKKALQLPSA
jgi:hypothetical protein